MSKHDFYLRRFRKIDTERCVDILYWLHQNSRYKTFTFNRNKVATYFQASLENTSHIYCNLVIHKDTKEIIGYLHGFIDKPYFSDSLQAGDFTLIIMPEYRRCAPKALPKLMDAYETWAKNKGAHEIMMGATTGSDSPAYRKFLEKRGYSPTGYAATKEI